MKIWLGDLYQTPKQKLFYQRNKQTNQKDELIKALKMNG